jgi:hypothetical protein
VVEIVLLLNRLAWGKHLKKRRKDYGKLEHGFKNVVLYLYGTARGAQSAAKLV